MKALKRILKLCLPGILFWVVFLQITPNLALDTLGVYAEALDDITSGSKEYMVEKAKDFIWDAVKDRSREIIDNDREMIRGWIDRVVN